MGLPKKGIIGCGLAFCKRLAWTGTIHATNQPRLQLGEPVPPPRFQLQASPAVMARGMLGMLRYDATAVLKDINVPALVVAGDRDSVCKPEASERMHRDIPDAQLTRLVPAKHMGLIEHHTRFAEIVRTFSSLCLPTATNGSQHSKP